MDIARLTFTILWPRAHRFMAYRRPTYTPIRRGQCYPRLVQKYTRRQEDVHLPHGQRINKQAYHPHIMQYNQQITEQYHCWRPGHIGPFGACGSPLSPCSPPPPLPRPECPQTHGTTRAVGTRYHALSNALRCIISVS